MKRYFSKKVLYCLTSFFASIFLLISGVLMPQISTIAFNKDNITTNTKTVGELWNSSRSKFNGDNVTKLLQLVSGDMESNVFYLDTIYEQAIETRTAQQMRASEIEELNKTNSQDIIVTLGGLDWTVTYLSTDKEGNPILTLWLANSYQLSGKKYNTAIDDGGITYGTGIFDKDGLVEKWADVMTPSKTSFTSNYPDNMYGTSYIRTVTLNNGGMFSWELMGLRGTAEVAPQLGNTFSVFTCEEDGYFNDLADFIVTPENVSWQENQSFKAQLNSSTVSTENCNRPNDAWSTETSDEGFKSKNFNYAHKSKSDDWKTDKIWLPSITETGSSAYLGIWELTNEQLTNNFTYWLRSGTHEESADKAGLLNNFGQYSSNSVETSQGLRPALHLNLKDIVEHTTTQKDINLCEIENYPFDNQQWNPIENIVPKIVVKDPVFGLHSQPVENIDYIIKVKKITGTEEGGNYNEQEYSVEKQEDGTYKVTGITEIGRIAIQIVGYEEEQENGLEDSRYKGTKTIFLDLTERDIALGLKSNDLTFPKFSYTSFEHRPTFENVRDYGYQPPEENSKADETGIKLVQDRDYTLSYRNNIEVGTATIIITGIGNYTGETSTTFEIERASIVNGKLTLNTTEVEYYFDESILKNIFATLTLEVKNTIGETVELTLVEGTDYDLFYYNKKDYVEDSDSTNLEIVFEIGSYYVVAVGKGNFIDSTKTEFEVTRATLKQNYLSLDSYSHIYTGNQITPTFNVSFEYVEGKVFNFELNTDYTFSYGENIFVSTGGGITITGVGKFRGDVTATFEITPKPLDSEDITNSEIDPLKYIVTALTPDFTLQDKVIIVNEEDGIVYTLVKGTDYSVEYKDNLNVGTATITITGLGNYGGTRIINFTIEPRDISLADIAFKDKDFPTYTGKELEPELLITDFNTTLVITRDYTTTYSNNIEVTENAKVLVEGTGNYTGNKELSFTILPRTIKDGTITLLPDTAVYRGYAVTPQVTLKLNDLVIEDNIITLDGNNDYDITYHFTNDSDSNKVDEMVGVGTYYIKLTGKVNYSGTISKEFTITPATFNSNNVEVTIPPTVDYTSKQITVDFNSNDVSVKYSNLDNNILTLNLNTDFKLFSGYIEVTFKEGSLDVIESAVILSTAEGENKKDNNNVFKVENGYFNNVNAGVATLVLTGLSPNYKTDTVVISQFTILQILLSKDQIEISNLEEKYIYTGEAITPTLGVKSLITNETFTKNKDYQIEYTTDNINVGKVTFVITGVGNYKGNVTYLEAFTIAPKPLEKVMFTISEDIEYDATVHKPVISAEYNGKTMLENIGEEILTNTAFKVSYYRNGELTTDFTSAGGITIEITGINNFENIITHVYSIFKWQINGIWLSSYQETYTGESLKPTMKALNKQGDEVSTDGYMFTFSSENWESGVEDWINVGSIKITVEITDNENYVLTRDEISTTFTINRRSIKTGVVTLSLSLETNEYKGYNLIPFITATLTLDGKTIEDFNYELTYFTSNANGQPNTNTEEFINVGIYYVRLTGVGNYIDYAQTTFEITKYDISKTTPNEYITSFTYNKLTRKPTITFSYNENTLVEGQDFDLVYHKGSISGATVTPIDCDTYYIEAKGKNNYKGSYISEDFTYEITKISISSEDVEVTFNDALNINDTSVLNNITFNNSPQKALVSSVTIGGIEVFDVSGDEIVRTYLVITYYRGDNVTTDFISQGTITIKITSANENNIIGSYEKSYTIKQKNLEDALSNNYLEIAGIEDRVYNRNVQTFNVRIVDNNASNYVLQLNKDYTITYETECIYAKEDILVTIASTKTGNYLGTITQTFTIKKAVVNSFSLVSNNQMYNAEAHTITEVVKAGNLTLNTTEYKVTHLRGETITYNLVNAGDIIVSLDLLDNDNFELDEELNSNIIFKINPAPIESVGLTSSSVQYDAERHTIVIASVTSTNNLTLTPRDYTVTYNGTNNDTYINRGEVIVEVTGTGNFTGTKQTTFTITERTITLSDVTFYLANKDGSLVDGAIQIDLENNKYVGDYVAPYISINEGRYDLVLDTDYDFAIYTLADYNKYYDKDYVGEKKNNLFGTDNYKLPNNYMLVITCKGNFTGTIAKSYKVVKADFNQSTISAIINASKTYTGNELILDFENDEVAITYTKKDRAGFEIVLGTDFNLYSGYVELTYLEDSTTISSVKILTASEYNDKKNNPNVFQLVNGYANNINAGTALLGIQGVAPNFQNTVAIIQYTISPITLGQTNLDISNLQEEYYYTGNEVIPDIIVTYSPDNRILEKDKDFTVTFAGGVNVSEIGKTFYITGINNYSGVVYYNNAYKIVPRPLSKEMFKITEDVEYDLKEHIPQILSAEFGGWSLNDPKDYSYLGMKRDGEEATDFVSVGEIVIQVQGNGNFTGLLDLIFTIKGISFTRAVVELSVSSMLYTGESRAPEVKVKFGETYLTEESYEISFVKDGETISSMINAGTYTILVTGKGDYADTASAEFTISPYDIKSTDIGEYTKSFSYNKEEQTPTIILSYGEMELKEGVDYTIKYVLTSQNGEEVSSPVNAGTYFVILTGKANYTGVINTISYEITKLNLNGENVIITFGNNINLENVTFNNTSQKAEITSIEINNLEFFNTNGEYLTLLYYRGAEVTNDFVSAGFITLKVTSTNENNIVGLYSKTYEIKQKELDSALGSNQLIITGLEDREYNRELHSVVVTITDSSINYLLKENKDYSISFDTDFTHAKKDILVTITSLNGNYKNSITQTFTISKAVIDVFELLETGGTYNRNPHIITDTVTAGELSLISGTEYEIVFKRDNKATDNLTDAGTIAVELLILDSTNFEFSSTLNTSIDFIITKAIIDSFTLSSTGAVFNREEHTIEETVTSGDLTLINNTEYEISYTRNEEETTNFTDAGTIVVTLMLPEVSNFEFDEDLETSKTYTIETAKLSSVTLKEDSITYDTNEHTIVISSVVTENGLTLKENEYSVTYNKTNIKTYKNVCDVSVSVTCSGNITGNIAVNFKINPRAINAGEIKYFIANADGTATEQELDLNGKYKGNLVLPSIEIAENNYKLKLNSDYSFAIYTKNDYNGEKQNNLFESKNYLDSGEYVFVITGLNNFSSIITQNYKVNSADFNDGTISIEFLEEKYYSGDYISFDFNKNEATITYTKNSSTDALMLKLNRDFRLYSGYVEVTFKENSTTEFISIRILTDNEGEDRKEESNVKYVRNGYINNLDTGIATLVVQGIMQNYTNSLVFKHFEILQVKLEVEISGLDEEYVYTGYEISPELTLVSKDTGETLVLDRDYKITYSNNINVGEAGYKIVGINNYSGETANAKAFNIIPRTITQDMFTISDDTTYNGSIQKPTITARFSGKVLVEDEDFTVVYKRNSVITTNFLDAGVISIELNGMSNFTGALLKTYSIAKLQIKEIILSQTVTIFNGSDQRPTIQVLDIFGNEVNSEEDTVIETNRKVYELTLSRDNFTDAGNTRIIVTIIDTTNYALYGAEVTATFTIRRAELSSATANIPNQVYSGISIEPKFSLMLGEYAIPTNEYNISNYTNNLNAGTAIIHLVSLNNNFEGTAEIPFIIESKPLEDTMLSVALGANPVYNGGEQMLDFTVSFNNVVLEVPVDYTYLYDNNINANDDDSAVLTIMGTGNFSGTINYNFSIDKANPIVIVGTLEQVLFVGDALLDNNYLVLKEGSTKGTLTNDPVSSLTLSNDIKWRFIPEDENNYNEVNDIERGVVAYYYTEVVFSDVSNLLTGQDVNVTASVMFKTNRNTDTFYPAPDGTYELAITLDGKDVTSEQVIFDKNTITKFIMRGTYNVKVNITSPNYYIASGDNKSFQVKTTTLQSSNNLFYAVCPTGFDNNITLSIKPFSNKEDIISLIGEEVYNQIGNIIRVYSVKFLRNNKEVQVANAKVYLNTSQNIFYSLSNGTLAQEDTTKGIIEVPAGAIIIEARNALSLEIIILISAGTGVLVTTILLVVIVNSKKKKKKLAQGNQNVNNKKLAKKNAKNHNLNNQNAIANGVNTQNGQQINVNPNAVINNALNANVPMGNGNMPYQNGVNPNISGQAMQNGKVISPQNAKGIPQNTMSNGKPIAPNGKMMPPQGMPQNGRMVPPNNRSIPPQNMVNGNMTPLNNGMPNGNRLPPNGMNPNEPRGQNANMRPPQGVPPQGYRPQGVPPQMGGRMPNGMPPNMNSQGMQNGRMVAPPNAKGIPQNMMQNGRPIAPNGRMMPPPQGIAPNGGRVPPNMAGGRVSPQQGMPNGNRLPPNGMNPNMPRGQNTNMLPPQGIPPQGYRPQGVPPQMGGRMPNGIPTNMNGQGMQNGRMVAPQNAKGMPQNTMSNGRPIAPNGKMMPPQGMPQNGRMVPPNNRSIPPQNMVNGNMTPLNNGMPNGNMFPPNMNNLNGVNTQNNVPPNPKKPKGK